MNDRFNICASCEFRDKSRCTINKMEFKDFINLRLATCPLFKWG